MKKSSSNNRNININSIISVIINIINIIKTNISIIIIINSNIVITIIGIFVIIEINHGILCEVDRYACFMQMYLVNVGVICGCGGGSWLLGLCRRTTMRKWMSQMSAPFHTSTEHQRKWGCRCK